jgi:DNA-binding transcriptional MerR regulator
MEALVTIGEFSRLSHLTTKALRHYHDVGLLRPELIDSSGYRRYAPGQVQQAQLVRRLRLLDMPVPEIAAVLAAQDDESRDRAIADHLQRMEDELGRTQQVVASLRALLRPPAAPPQVEYRTVGELTVLGIRAEVRKSGVERWLSVAFPQLYEAVARSGVDPAGAGGATYDARFFEDDVGEVVAFVPVARRGSVSGPAEPLQLAAGRFAVAVHAGAFDDIDISYGRLGSHVARDDQPLPLPIREHYLIGPNHTADPPQFRTEIWWPISATPPEEQETSPWQ